MTNEVALRSNTSRVALHIAVYNAEKYIESAVCSVLEQTYRDFDLMLWDDGSTDGSRGLLEKFTAADARVRVTGGHHVGVAKAHEQAIDAGSSEFIGWIDADDLLAPTALAETVAALDAHPNAGFVYTDYVSMDESGKRFTPGKLCQIPYSSERLLVDFMTFHFRLIRRSVFDAVGGMDVANQNGAEDYDLCLRLSERAAVLHIAKPLYYYRHHAQSFSNTKRLDQLAASIAAINRALVRRGMDETHELRVEISSQAQLVKKGVPETVSKPPGEPVRNRGLNVAVGRKQSMKRTQSLRA